MTNWKQQLEEQITKKLDNYTVVTVNLDTARLDEPIATAGKIIYVEDVSSESAEASVRLNRIGATSLVLRNNVSVKTVFYNLFLTNAAQPGEWLRIIFGREFSISSPSAGGGLVGSEAQPAVKVTNAVPDTNTVCDANICDKVLLRADTKNAGLAWLDFGTPAIENACYPLEAGDAISFPLSNTNRINVLFKMGGDFVIIVRAV